VTIAAGKRMQRDNFELALDADEGKEGESNHYVHIRARESTRECGLDLPSFFDTAERRREAERRRKSNE
jgi:hypothetical protein